MMESVDLTACVRESLAAITAPRFFATERGFQGELLVQLARHVRLPSQVILEQEYQKRQRRHGLAIRPDIIIHEPFDPLRHAARTEGNYAVVELKLNATAAQASDDYQSLADMIRILQYPLGIFINIDSTTTHGDLVPNDVRGRVVSFAVVRRDGMTQVIEERL